MSTVRTPAETPAQTPAGALVPQPHGGALRHGSLPGNPPGPGAPPSELRARLRGSLEQRVRVVEEIADRADASDADRLRAIDLLARYGLGTTRELSVEHVRGKLAETLQAIRESLPQDQAEALIGKLRWVWR